MRVAAKPSPAAPLPLLLIVWWLANNVYAIDAERFFTTFTTPHLFVDLTLCQVLVGFILTRVYLHYVGNTTVSAHAQAAPTPQSTAQARYSLLPHLPLLIPLLHYFATMLTNISYSTLGSTTTLLWKLCEPAAAAILNRVLLSQTPTPLSSLGVVLTLLGVYRFSATTFTLPTFSPIILSNILFPLRNVFIKMEQGDEKDGEVKKDTPVQRFVYMVRAAVPLAAAVFLGKLCVYGFNIPAVPYMLRNTLLFTAYQLASFILLERLDALTHSLLNTLKRFTGILLSMLVLQTAMNAPHLQGIALTLVGFTLYLAGRKRGKLSLSPTAIGLAVVAGFMVMAAFVGVSVMASGMREVSFVKSGLVSVKEKIDVNVNNGRYIILPMNEYRMTRRNVRYKSYNEVAADNGGNTGNLVWQYGAHEALPDFGGIQFCRKERGECAEMAGEMGKELLVYYPMANTLNPSKLNWFGMLRKSIEDYGGSTMIVGVGVQVEYRENSPDPQMNSTARITTTSDDYKHPANTKKLLQVMEEQGGEMLLRGDFSLNVTRRGGFSRGYSVGCPSLWINEDVHLGRTLERRYKAIARRVGDKSLKIAVVVKKLQGFERFIAHFRDNYPNSRFYAQGTGDMAMLRAMGVPFERARFFTNVQDWMADLREMDVAFGVRIHGNMIAMGAGLPVFVVASDWRILELVQRMRIPHLTSFDPVLENERDVAKLIARMPRFDGDAFDRNRCQIAKDYMKMFAKFGIGVKKHVRDVSKLC